MTTDMENDTNRYNRSTCCDIFQKGDNIIMKMEMPGVSKDDLNVQVDGDHLVIEANKQEPETRGEYRVREIRDGDYRQEFTIDDTIDPAKINAVMKNGILRLELGLKEAEKPRKIKIASK